MKNLIKKNICRMSAAMCAVLTCAAPAFASGGALSSAANNAAQGIQAEAKSAVIPIVTIVLIIIGVMLIVGGQRGREMAKSQAFSTIIGIALIAGAGAIAAWSVGLFG